MQPRHFWALVETLEPQTGDILSDDDREELLAMLREAQENEA